jgi:hypothetical protein
LIFFFFFVLFNFCIYFIYCVTLFDVHRNSIVATKIHSSSGAPLNDSVRLTSLFAASGVLKGLPSVTHPHVYIVLQEVLVTALHGLGDGVGEDGGDNTGGVNELWKSAVGLALAHSGLCSKNTTLGIFLRLCCSVLFVWFFVCFFFLFFCFFGFFGFFCLFFVFVFVFVFCLFVA